MAMKSLVMTLTDLDGKVLKIQSIEVNTNKLNTFAAPGVSGHDIYKLKKQGTLVFDGVDGKFTYELKDIE